MALRSYGSSPCREALPIRRGFEWQTELPDHHEETHPSVPAKKSETFALSKRQCLLPARALQSPPRPSVGPSLGVLGHLFGHALPGRGGKLTSRAKRQYAAVH